MRLLAIDTATEACSAAVLADDVLTMRYEVLVRGHAARILPMIDEVLREARLSLSALDVLAVGRGPGAFTGVRIAIGVAQGLGYGAGKQVVPVSDLAALAQRGVAEYGARTVLAAIDARMNEVYWAQYEVGPQGLVQLVGEEHVAAPDAVALPAGRDWFAAGTGWATEAMSARAAELGIGVDATLLPRAREIAELARRDAARGRAVPPDRVLPVYLRDTVAQVPVKKP